ncbi:MAG: phosphopantothenoylcysteine decarboxylase [Deltaproteobacteria bacterium]|nr:phosphopantothenoylcysteine decarboxylase [Deltaproteobacteria bacterium]
MHLLLVVSGGIAAYKACEVASLAVRAGHRVRVAMTPNATRFVSPLTFRALSGQHVFVDCFREPPDEGIDHVEWARWASVAVVAPATANLLGKLACGIADDAASTVLIALPREVPVVLAPAMNTAMWLNPVVQRNLGWLADLGRFHVVEPIEKRLACGDVGPGAMADPAEVLARAEALARPE